MKIFDGADNTLLYLNLQQQKLADTAKKLASGLRIETAADDPSGLAISETLKTRITGLQQSVTNVQTGANLLTVADAALGTAQQILQRIRSLTVEAHSDINSNEQLSAIQTEIDQLLVEINKIGSDTNFNGLNLLSGLFDTSLGKTSTATIIQSPQLTPSGGVPSSNVSNYDALGNSGPLVSAPAGLTLAPGGGAGYFTPALVVFSVIGYSSNAFDQPSQTYVGPGVEVQVTGYNAQGGLGSAPEFSVTEAVPVNFGQINTQITAPNNTLLFQNVNIANLTSADVGSSIAIETTLATQAANGTALSINDGGTEGATVSISLPTLSTNNLNISGISVLRPAEETYDPTTGTYIVTGDDSSNNFAAADAEYKVDTALDTISGLRAQIGAQIVSLGEDASNDSTGIVNYTASESAIRDLDVAAATTDFTREQLLVSVGTSILSQQEVNSRDLTSLLVDGLNRNSVA